MVDEIPAFSNLEPKLAHAFWRFSTLNAMRSRSAESSRVTWRKCRVLLRYITLSFIYNHLYDISPWISALLQIMKFQASKGTLLSYSTMAKMYLTKTKYLTSIHDRAPRGRGQDSILAHSPTLTPWGGLTIYFAEKFFYYWNVL